MGRCADVNGDELQHIYSGSQNGGAVSIDQCQNYCSQDEFCVAYAYWAASVTCNLYGQSSQITYPQGFSLGSSESILEPTQGKYTFPDLFDNCYVKTSSTTLFLIK